MSDDIEITNDQEKGRLLHTTADINEGAVLLKVPWDQIITGRNSDSDPEMSSLVPVPELQLFLKLLFAESENHFSTYIDSIPTSFSTGVYYQPSDVACLSTDGRNHYKYQQDQYKEFSKLAHAVHKEENYAFPMPGDNIIRWTYSAVFTRAVRIDDDTAALIPIFDMINHSYKPNVLFDFDDKGITLFAGVSLLKNTELLLSYGSHLTPSKLLVLYGFADSTFERISGGVQIHNDGSVVTKPLIDIGCHESSELFINVVNSTASEKLIECVTLSILPTATRNSYPSLPIEDKDSLLSSSKSDAYQVYGAHLVKVISQIPHPDDAECSSDTGHVPLIREANRLMRSAYMSCKDGMDAIIKSSGARRVEVQKNNKYENEDLDSDDEEL